MFDRQDAHASDLKQIARCIFEQALAECSVDRAFERALRTVSDSTGSRLIVGGDTPVELDPLRRVRIVSAGKAAGAMLTSLLSGLPLPPQCDLQGVLIAAERPQNLPAGIEFFAGGHPVPNDASFAGAAAALSMLHALGAASPEDTLCIFLISGGASAMMELPLDRAISLDDTVAFHQALVYSGASIVEMNCVRKHFSAVKGGRLALAAGDAQKLSLLISDVPPANIDALASGPTIADPTTVAECRAILTRYQLLQHFPSSVQRFFLDPQLQETPKPGDVSSQCWTLMDSDELAEIARAHAMKLGFHAVIDNTCDDWAYDLAANYLLNRMRQLRHEHRRVCVISTGEVTVKVVQAAMSESARVYAAGLDTGTSIGGRNQHFALYLATQIGAEDASITALSAGSDGIDGNSKAAGAVVDEHTLDGDYPLRFAAEDGTMLPLTRPLSAYRALERFDSSTWLYGIGATIVTGPTGHNLRDLRILLSD